MRSIIALTLFILIAGCAAAEGRAKEVQAQGVRIDEYTWDFGSIKQGEKPKHEFAFVNRTKKPLNIKQVNTSCGCTASQVSKKVLQPGESAVITVTFNSKGYSGAVQQFIYVNTDDVENPVTRFIVKAEVVKN